MLHTKIYSVRESNPRNAVQQSITEQLSQVLVRVNTGIVINNQWLIPASHWCHLFYISRLLNLPRTITNAMTYFLFKSAQPFLTFSETNEQLLIFINKKKNKDIKSKLQYPTSRPRSLSSRSPLPTRQTRSNTPKLSRQQKRDASD